MMLRCRVMLRGCEPVNIRMMLNVITLSQDDSWLWYHQDAAFLLSARLFRRQICPRNPPFGDASTGGLSRAASGQCTAQRTRPAGGCLCHRHDAVRIIMMLLNSSGRRLCLFSDRYGARNRLWLVYQHHPVNIIVLLIDSLGRCLRVYVAHYAE